MWGRAEQQDFRSRVRGALLGSAIGDALGAPVAALTLDAIHEAHGPAGLTEPAPPPAPPLPPGHARGRALARAHGTPGQGRGAITAATQLTLFTVDGLIRAHVRRDTGAWHPPTDVHRAYLRWAATQSDWGPDERREDNGWLAQQEWLYTRRDPARACLTGFADALLGTPDQPKNPAARDAAAAARSAPFGLLVGWESALVLQLSVECAAQSHGHPTAYLSAGAFAVIVHGLTRGESLDSAVQRALGLLGARPGHQPVTDALQRALAAVTLGVPSARTVEALVPGHDREGHAGHADHTGQTDHTDPADRAGHSAEDVLAIAVYCALVAENVAHGLRLAVNHGGDSTATGALCGALLGAQHGETALPAGWLAELEGRATVLELADDFALEMTQGPALHGPALPSSGWLTRYPRG
ncbi:ADP-ribosylglycohydrolase family protein [Streptomyces sp. NPDC006544]|uniref:ADP-ribosylglycohydrolase family protein n=1 Tax=Streptomyces sp. NPDC006544 TaxID=3154583 RepID=UPI0033AADD34